MEGWRVGEMEGRRMESWMDRMSRMCRWTGCVDVCSHVRVVGVYVRMYVCEVCVFSLFVCASGFVRAYSACGELRSV
jgi:hypothetical protein